MSTARTASPVAPAPDAPDEDAEALRPLRRVLSATVSAAGLITLELQAGPAHPSLLVRSRSSLPVPGLAVWPTRIAPCAWHDGILLVATAVTADPARRVAVHSAATLVADLVIAERRRRDAEVAASRAVDLAGVDALTGLGNRRTWRRAIDDEALRAGRYGRPTTVVVVDLDGLKRINDEQGHCAGDGHLQQAATALRAAARSVDLVCRLGGDEFGVLAPETDAEGAVCLTSRLRTHLDRAGVPASLGVATRADGDLERAWHLADADMYRHKRVRTGDPAVLQRRSGEARPVGA